MAAVIEQRKGAPPEESYTSTLLAGGAEQIRKKIVEEAAEVFEAAGVEGASAADRLTTEVADLLYHVLVLLAAKGIELAEVEHELATREGVSGLQEKRERKT